MNTKIIRWLFTIASIALLFCVPGQASLASPSSGVHVIESASILGYSERPGAGSGYIHFLRAIMVSTPDGRVLTLVTTYEGEDQFFPAIGSQCLIAYDDREVRGVVGRTVGHAVTASSYVTRLECHKGTAREGLVSAN